MTAHQSYDEPSVKILSNPGFGPATPWHNNPVGLGRRVIPPLDWLLPLVWHECLGLPIRTGWPTKWCKHHRLETNQILWEGRGRFDHLGRYWDGRLHSRNAPKVAFRDTPRWSSFSTSKRHLPRLCPVVQGRSPTNWRDHRPQVTLGCLSCMVHLCSSRLQTRFQARFG